MKYSPHEYQEYAKRFIIEHPEAAIFLDCGMGKTVITLAAIQELINYHLTYKQKKETVTGRKGDIRQ